MATNVNIDKIWADLEKKFNGDANHDVQVVQEYCRTLPPCEESAKLVGALGKQAAEKFPEADAIKMGKTIDNAIAELEKQFNGDPNHDVKVIQDYCQSLPKTQENFKLVMALGQYAAAKYPEADEVKKSKAEFEKMNEDAKQLKARIDGIQEKIKAKDIAPAIEEIRAIIDETKIPNPEEQRLISFSHPFEEIIFQASIKEFKETRKLVRVSNLMEMLHLQLGGLLSEQKNYDEALDAFNHALEFNPVSAPASLEIAHIAILKKNYEEAFELLKKAYPLIFTRSLLAIYYSFLAEVVENVDKNYPLAVAYVYVSLDYAENPLAREALNRLGKVQGIDLSKPTVEAMRKLANDANLPLGPNPAVCELAVKAARQIKSQHPDVAKQLFAIAYDLTGQESLLKEIR